MPNRLLTAEQVAARFQITTDHVYGLTRSGALPAVKLGRYYRYALDAIQNFETNGGTAA